MTDTGHVYTAEEEAAMAVIRRWCDEGWTQGKVQVADEIIHPNFKVHGAGGQVIEPGIEGLKQLILAWRTGFPDAVQRVDEIFAVGGTVYDAETDGNARYFFDLDEPGIDFVAGVPRQIAVDALVQRHK